MRRCLELAMHGIGSVAPNPMVGAVLVYQDRIIGEGYHQSYGQPHAEVNCINSVTPGDVHLICKSILYVSLEPCNHFGKTPPCTDFIIKNKIPHVVIGCTDSFEKVAGSGIEKLRAAGIKTTLNILHKECREINKRFFTYHEKKRSYIFLKWAQSHDGIIAGEDGKPIKISNAYSDRLVHRWRGEEAAILIGRQTAIQDDPALTARHWPGKNPVRIIIDPELKVPLHAKIYNEKALTIILNSKKSERKDNIIFYKIRPGETFIEACLRCSFEKKLTSVIIEGGSKTLQNFIDIDLWDEAIIITNNFLQIEKGVTAPILRKEILLRSDELFSDTIKFYKNAGNEFL